MLAVKDLTVVRNRRISKVPSSHKEKFAQYLTPVEIARFMAQLGVRNIRGTFWRFSMHQPKEDIYGIIW
jgi:hypothetical protein